MENRQCTLWLDRGLSDQGRQSREIGLHGSQADSLSLLSYEAHSPLSIFALRSEL